MCQSRCWLAKGGAHHGKQYACCCRLGKVGLSDRPLGPPWKGDTPRAATARQVSRVLCAAASGDRDHGGLRVSALLGTEDRGAGACGRAASAPLRTPLRIAEQDRPNGHRRDLGGISKRADPPGANQVGDAAGARDAAPSPIGVGRRADGTDQLPSRPVARAGVLHPCGEKRGSAPRVRDYPGR
jgi:hypothetical protein